MENQPFPSDVNQWTWDTIQSLVDSRQPENTYLEYKRQLHHGGNQESSRTEWRKDIEREFTAFANASGGIIVFGVSDDWSIILIDQPEHGISQSISQMVQNSVPPVETNISPPLEPPNAESGGVVIAVRVYEMKRKPVKTSDSSFYIRINEQKHPMSREQIESLFVETDRRQQAVRRLEMEIDRYSQVFKDVFENYNKRMETPPEYTAIEIDAIRTVLRENNHLYDDDELKDIVQRIFRTLRVIESHQREYERKLEGIFSKPDGGYRFDRRDKLGRNTRRLMNDLERLSGLANLNVEIENG